MKKCPDCGVEPGQEHMGGCDVECCLTCGKQAVCCGCCERRRQVWTGEWSGAADAREYGFFCRWNGTRWVPCRKNEEGAKPDLNRVRMECIWDREQGRWVKS